HLVRNVFLVGLASRAEIRPIRCSISPQHERSPTRADRTNVDVETYNQRTSCPGASSRKAFRPRYHACAASGQFGSTWGESLRYITRIGQSFASSFGASEFSRAIPFAPARTTTPPLPWGEGWGEGEGAFQKGLAGKK